MKGYTSELIQSHYSTTEPVEQYPDRIRQINISVSIDTFAMLKVQAEHFGQSLSAFCADILYHASFDVLKEVSNVCEPDARKFLVSADQEAVEESKRQGLPEFQSYWDLCQKWDAKAKDEGEQN